MKKTYYPEIGIPIHEVRDWVKVRRLIRALREGDDVGVVYIDGEIGNCSILSGTHRLAASEIRSQLDGTEPYADLNIIDINDILDDRCIDVYNELCEDGKIWEYIDEFRGETTEDLVRFLEK